MDNAPQFDTAVPKRRYKIGEFNAVVLHDIESKDGNEYVYAFALVPEGESEPSLYVSLEKVTGAKLPFLMRVTVEGQTRPFPANQDMADIDRFTEMAIDAAVTLFKLTDEEPYRLL